MSNHRSPSTDHGDWHHRHPFHVEPTLLSCWGTARRFTGRRSAINGSCLKCGAGLEGSWKFCPHCGETSAPVQVHPLHDHEKAPAKYVFSGVLFGIITAPALIIYGTMICLLGPAMVLGIPLIIAGIAAPFLGPYLAINAVRGNCPWCGAKITSVGPLDAFFCHACSRRIEVKNRELVKAA